MSNSLASEHIVLTDKEDHVLGIANKIEGHNANTPLHRGFSAFIFNTPITNTNSVIKDNKNIKLLMQKRSNLKKTWPNFWSNSFCGHPQLGESYEEAVIRCAQFELNIKVHNLFKISDYKYRYENNNIVENEICPIFCISEWENLMNNNNEDIKFNKDEMSEIKWFELKDLSNMIENSEYNFSPWCIDELNIINDKLVKIF